jgi:tetratricopeptide (TPR) repeat protein
MTQTVASESPQDIAKRAEEHRLKKEYNSAIDLFTQAIEADKNYAWAYAHRGAARRDDKNVNDAVKDLKRAIELRGNYAWAEANLGYTYFKAENFEDVQKHFKTAIKINPEYAWALAHLAEVIYERNKTDKAQLEEALAYINRAIDSVSQYAFAFALRAAISYALGDLADSPELGDYKTAAEKYQSSAQDILKALWVDPNIFASPSAKINLQSLFSEEIV